MIKVSHISILVVLVLLGCQEELKPDSELIEYEEALEKLEVDKSTVEIRENTPLDMNDSANLRTLHDYLERNQYGSISVYFGDTSNNSF